MANEPIELSAPLYQALVNDTIDGFSVLELRDKFVSFSRVITCTTEARRFVYRHILRLVKLKRLEKRDGKTSHGTRYFKTELFDKTDWNIVELESCSVLVKQQSSEFTQKESDVALTDSILAKRLEQCESDFHACLYEYEAYKELCNEFPHLDTKLCEVRKQTREQSSKLLGEMRAIKMALNVS